MNTQLQKFLEQNLKEILTLSISILTNILHSWAFDNKPVGWYANIIVMARDSAFNIGACSWKVQQKQLRKQELFKKSLNFQSI